MVVSQVFFDVTIKAHQLFVETKGIFNPLVSVFETWFMIKILRILKMMKRLEMKVLYDIDFSTTKIDNQTL